MTAPEGAAGRDFAAVLRAHRRSAGLTQEALAERARLSARTISDLERGVKLAPRRQTLDLLAEALELSEPERAAFAAAGRPPRPAPPERAAGRPPAAALSHRREVPLLAIAGSPGAGAALPGIEVAGRLRDESPDGVCLVLLAAPLGPELVGPAVAATLRAVAGTPGRDAPPGALPATHPRGWRLLLLPDHPHPAAALQAPRGEHDVAHRPRPGLRSAPRRRRARRRTGQDESLRRG